MKERYYVWQLAERNEVLEVVCEKCGYKGRIYTQGLTDNQKQKPVQSLRFRCTQCGSNSVCCNA